MEDKIQHSKPVPPFVRFCSANIPMVFDDSLSYYECLCALWKWLQTDVIDVINNNATVTQKWREELTEFEGNVTDEIEEFESDMRSDFSDLNDAFDTLKNWVEHYFDNLDVQEEINNKLDAMAEAGTLADIIAAYLNSIAIFGYDNVASMKSSTNLASGSYARTMGYHAKDDGGSAIYKVRPVTNDDVIDEMFIIELSSDPSNHLVAELITNKELNIKQLGAYGDGTHDDTAKFTAGITHLKNQYSVDNIFIENLTLTIPTGTYLVSSTINLPAVVKLNITGHVLIKSDVYNNPTIWVNSDSILKASDADTDSNIIKQQSYNIAKQIGGIGTLCIERNTETPLSDVNDLTKTSVGIEIGDRTYNANYISCARATYENIAITGFATAIQINSINTYLLNFDNLKLERNRVNVSWGDINGSRHNAGENIKFNKSTLAGAYNSVVFNQRGEFTFDECSFDFNGNCILCNTNVHLVINAPHIEGVGFHQENIIETSDSNCTGFGTIIYNNYDAQSPLEITCVEMNNPDYYLDSSNYKIVPRYQSGSTNNYPTLVIDHNSLQPFNEAGYTFGNVFMNGKNVVINDFNTTLKNTTIPNSPFSDNDQLGKLDGIPNDLASLDALSNNYGYSAQGIASVSVDTSDKVFNKSLKYVVDSKTWFNLRRTFKNTGKKFTVHGFFKPELTGNNGTFDHLSFEGHIYFYQANNIASGTTVELYFADSHLMKDADTNWLVTRGAVINVPEGTDHIMVAYNFLTKDSGGNSVNVSGDVLLGGIIINYL